MARFTGGWIKIHHSILDHPVSHRGMFTFGIFIRLLVMANWKPSSIIFAGKKMTLKAGQLVTGLRELSPDKDEDPYLNKIRASLDYLVLCEAIEQVSNNQGRLITIRNWAKYQSRESPDSETSTSEEQTSHKQSTSEPQLSEEVRIKKEERESLSEENLGDCIQAWGQTLERHGVRKKPELDQEQIARLIQRHGADRTKLALLGAGFEEGSPDYDPKKHVSILRLQKPAVFETFVNLGAQLDSGERQTTKWNIGQC